MMIGNRKEEGKVYTVLLHVFRKSPTPCENWLTAILKRKKPKYAPGSGPSLTRPNAFAQPVVLPPLPKFSFLFSYWEIIESCGVMWTCWTLSHIGSINHEVNEVFELWISDQSSNLETSFLCLENLRIWRTSRCNPTCLEIRSVSGCPIPSFPQFF